MKHLSKLALCLALAMAPATAMAADGAHWSYGGEGGPAEWGELSADYAACATGLEQSPVDLVTKGSIWAEVAVPEIFWQSSTLKDIVNNGHTIQVNTSGNSHIMLDGTRFDLKQFHFHSGSEHTVDGGQYPLEVHFVHASEGGKLAVIGVFFEPGDANAALAKVFDNMPKEKGHAAAAGIIDLHDLLPADTEAFRYAGSLTTPPCSEIVSWTVYRHPVTASTAQIKAFADLFPHSYRPVQPANRRFILHAQ